jgi:hypothetical protein
MNPKEVNYTATQGDSFILRILYTDSNKNPIDLTGYTARIEVRDKPGGKIVCATGSMGDGITISNPTSGYIDVNLTPAKTKKFMVPRSAYQIQVTSTNGTVSTIGNGWLIVNPGVID